MSFSKPTVRSLVNESIEVLNKHFAERGINFQRGNASFDAVQCQFKVEATAPGVDPARAKFEADCHAFGLSAEDYGRTFEVAGDAYKLVGVRIRAPKLPIIGKSSTGKDFVFPRAVLSDLSPRA